MPASRRDELIDAAMRIFARNGFHATGIERILQESGISRMTLYNHFKSKDELIVAALRRRDEIFRNRLLKFVEAREQDPVAQILAVFDFHAEWFAESGFSGCMFINVAGEYPDTDSKIRRVAAEHKLDVVRYLRGRCEAAGLRDSGPTAQQLFMLLEGAIIMAQVISQVEGDEADPADAARCARQAAEHLINAARAI